MTGVILQARMASTRLPGKILMKIGNKSLLDHIIFRLLYLKHETKFVIATTHLPQDDIVEGFCRARKIECFRGSSENVLERYFFCATKFRFSDIVRLTGDNPFVGINELDALIALHQKSKSDYTHSFDTLPVGVGSEIFTFDALKKSYLNGKSSHHREHVNEYITDNPALFSISELKFTGLKNRPNLRMTVDTEEDYKKACYIVEHSHTEFITVQEAITLCMQYA